MKLSAPPPPPPEPPEPPEPGQNPDANANAPVPAQAPPAPTPIPSAEAKPIGWPAWFTGADFLLAALAVALAFLLASFVARNSDLWVHLAAGKRLLAGEYRPGTDPFSYSAADRAWVNHSLLFDVGAYLLYGGRGVVLVVAKALAVAVAFGLLIGIRRSGFSLWPWAAVAAVAVIAAAPRMTLAPLVGSVVLLSVTQFLLFRTEHRPGSWRFPVAIGITFWLWANVDAWFIAGPLALALVLVGELLEGKKSAAPAVTPPGPAETPPAEEPLGRLPDVPTLVRALVVGVVACMLTPHHVRVWELPFELVGAPGAKDDPRLRAVLWKPLDSEYTKFTSLGYNLNGLAYGVLFIGGGLVLGLGLGAGRVRFAHLALWIGFALLSLWSIFAIPLFAVVAVPLVAAQFNALSARVHLKSWGDPRTRFVLLGSAGGRVLCLIAVLAACVVSWPGWLHPESPNPAFARRVAWAVEPEGGMVQAAEQIQAWRASGTLPPEARGVITSAELANYCAWFAPLEKVYCNTRYDHHARELPAYLAIRSGLGLYKLEDEPDARALADNLGKVGAEYVVVATGPSDGDQLQMRARLASFQMWLDADHWSAWYLDGRSAICGWRAGPGAEKPTFAALRVDPVALAFGPQVEPLPPGVTTQLPPVAGWESEFIRGAALAPPGADEALGWVGVGEHSLIPLGYKEALVLLLRVKQEKERMRQSPKMAGLEVGGGLVGAWNLLATELAAGPVLLPPPASDGSFEAVPILALRAARRAIAANPDHPDGYFALSQVLRDPGLPMPDSERTLARLTALRQCLVRMSPPDRFRPGAYRATAWIVAAELATLHLGRQVGPTQFTGIPIDTPSLQTPLAGSGVLGFLVADRGQPRMFPPALVAQLQPSDQVQLRRMGRPHVLALDLAREYLVLANKYAAVELGGAGERNKDQLEGLKNGLKIVEDELVKENKAYEQEKLRSAGQMKLRDQFRAALRHNLVGEALRLLTDKDTDMDKEFGPDVVSIAHVALQRLALELVVGRLEDVAGDLDRVAERVDASAARPEGRVLYDSFRGITYQKLVFEGNYAEAGKVMEQLEGGVVDNDPAKPLRAKFDPSFYVKLKEKVLVWPQVAPFTTYLSPSPFDLALRIGTPWAALNPYGQDEAGNPHPGFLGLQQDLAGRRGREVDFFLRRGILSLMEGDIPAARTRFESTRQPAVPDWGLPEYKNPQAEMYLRLIDQAAKKSPAK